MSADDKDQTDLKDQTDDKDQTGSEDSGDEEQTADNLELSDEGKEEVRRMREAYDDDRATAVLPGTGGTITGVAISEWIDDDGNPKFGKDEQEKKDKQQEKDEQQEGEQQEKDEQEEKDKQQEDAG
ncbi:hypothetical protein [Mycobacterium sp.]|uniref:hypothetical protein n=1 Tax=Mycobacterium sp. TaxID=1785 RepID=UPI003C75AFBA